MRFLPNIRIAAAVALPTACRLVAAVTFQLSVHIALLLRMTVRPGMDSCQYAPGFEPESDTA